MHPLSSLNPRCAGGVKPRALPRPSSSARDACESRLVARRPCSACSCASCSAMARANPAWPPRSRRAPGWGAPPCCSGRSRGSRPPRNASREPLRAAAFPPPGGSRRVGPTPPTAPGAPVAGRTYGASGTYLGRSGRTPVAYEPAPRAIARWSRVYGPRQTRYGKRIRVSRPPAGKRVGRRRTHPERRAEGIRALRMPAGTTSCPGACGPRT